MITSTLTPEELKVLKDTLREKFDNPDTTWELELLMSATEKLGLSELSDEMEKDFFIDQTRALPFP